MDIMNRYFSNNSQYYRYNLIVERLYILSFLSEMQRKNKMYKIYLYTSMSGIVKNDDSYLYHSLYSPGGKIDKNSIYTKRVELEDYFTDIDIYINNSDKIFFLVNYTTCSFTLIIKRYYLNSFFIYDFVCLN